MIKHCGRLKHEKFDDLEDDFIGLIDVRDSEVGHVRLGQIITGVQAKAYLPATVILSM